MAFFLKQLQLLLKAREAFGSDQAADIFGHAVSARLPYLNSISTKAKSNALALMTLW